MRNKGFTLVELLAVIVVLSIIALIGYSSVGNIISSSQDSSNKVTMKNYAKAVDQAVFLYEMNNEDSDLTELNSTWLKENVKFEKATVECDYATYDKTSSLYGCKVNDSDKTYCYTSDTAVECNKDKLSKIYGNSTQNRIPTPTSPVEVESVGEKTKNLFDYDNIPIVSYVTKQNNGYKASSSDAIRFYTYQSLANHIGETVTISFDLTTSEAGDFRIYQYQSNGIGISFTSITKKMDANTATRITLTGKVEELGTNENYSKGEIIVYKSGYTGNYFVNNIQFELGDTATEYEPYGYKVPITVSNGSDTKTTNIYLKEPLRKVGEYADYLDLTNKKVVRNVKEVVFNGTEVLVKTDITSLKTEYIYPRMKLASSNSTSIIWASTHIKSGITTYSSNIPTAIEFRDINRNFNIEYDVTKFQDWLKEQYNLNNPMKIDYILETPTEENVTVPEIPSLSDGQKCEDFYKVNGTTLECGY